MASDLRADYQILAETANQFGGETERVKKITQKLGQGAEALQTTWIGRGAQTFQQEMATLIMPEFRRLVAALQQSGITIQQVSQIFQTAEQEAAGYIKVGGNVADGTPGPGGGVGPGGGTPGPGTQPGGSPSLWDRVVKGIDTLYQTGAKAWSDFKSTVLSPLVQASDKTIDGLLSKLLPYSQPGSSEKLEFEIKGDVTIPGAEVGVPGSFKLAGAKTGSLTHNPDGTYTLTLSDKAGVGLEADLVEGKAGVKAFESKYGVGVDAGAEASLVGKTEVAFKFDPKVPGDMTKMAAFMGGMGLSQTLPGVVNPVGVAPALYTLKDNLQSFQVGTGVEGKANADLSALVRLAGVDVKGEAMTGAMFSKNDAGQWEASSYVKLGGGGNAQLVHLEGGGEASIKLQDIHNLSTGEHSSRVTLEAQAGGNAGQALDFKDLKSYLPPGMSGAKFGGGQYGKVTAEYTLREPAATVYSSIFDNPSGQPSLQPIFDNSTVSVTGTQGTTFGLGASAEVGAATQSIGLGGEVNVTRESEIPIYSYTGVNVQP